MQLEFHRLKDSHAREGREDFKRVYELRHGRDCAVVNFYTVRSDATVKQFRKNVRILKILARHSVSAPRLLYASEKDLVFVVTHVGEQLDVALQRLTPPQGKRAIREAAQIILDLASINAKKHPFMPPYPMERFEEAWKRKVFASSSETARKLVKEALIAMRSSASVLAKTHYRYGLGRVDGDLINFTYDAKKRKVFTVDFDGLQETYDPYYQLGYLWVSIERLHQKRHQPRKVAELRTALEEAVPWDESSARERFALGAASAMSIAIFHRPRETNMIRARTKEIHDVLSRFKTAP